MKTKIIMKQTRINAKCKYRYYYTAKFEDQHCHIVSLKDPQITRHMNLSWKLSRLWFFINTLQVHNRLLFGLPKY